jgi:hypothetical protein
MAIYKAQVSLQLDSALPRDAITINPHYHGTDPQALADALLANIKSLSSIGAIVPVRITIYNAQGPPPHYPLAQVGNADSPPSTNFPRDVALCLSYYAVNNRPHLRGRLYIPCFLTGSAPGLRPTPAQRTAVGLWADKLGKSLPSGHWWTVYSRKLDSEAQVTNWWVDDEWDTVRSRGLRSTTRTTGTIP